MARDGDNSQLLSTGDVGVRVVASHAGAAWGHGIGTEEPTEGRVHERQPL